MADLNVRVDGIRQDGGPAALASVVFTVESGTATLAPGADAQSQIVSGVDNESAVIRIDANADLSGGSRILTARLYLNGSVVIPSNEAVSISVTTR